MVPPVKNWALEFMVLEGYTPLNTETVIHVVAARDEAHADEVAENLALVLKGSTGLEHVHSATRVLEDPTT